MGSGSQLSCAGQGSSGLLLSAGLLPSCCEASKAPQLGAGKRLCALLEKETIKGLSSKVKGVELMRQAGGQQNGSCVENWTRARRCLPVSGTLLLRGATSHTAFPPSRFSGAFGLRFSVCLVIASFSQ